MAKVLAVCVSKEKGLRKDDVGEAVVKENYGLDGDAHADSSWHRQVSLLAIESIDKMRKAGLEVKCGDFAENITTGGIELYTLPIGTRLSIGKDVILEISQIGKECHTGCAIRELTGDCIMPREGVFAKVIEGGVVKRGDEIMNVGLPATTARAKKRRLKKAATWAGFILTSTILVNGMAVLVLMVPKEQMTNRILAAAGLSLVGLFSLGVNFLLWKMTGELWNEP